MKLKGTLTTISGPGKAIIFFGICLLFMSIGSVLAYFLSQSLFKIDLLEENLISHIKNQNVINSYKLAQGLPALGLFILAPLFYAYLFYKKPAEFLKTNKRPDFMSILVFAVVMLACTPAINYLLYINEKLDLPLFMRESEDQAALFTNAFLSTASINGLVFNLIVIAIIPAIGEEFMFRGVVQQSFLKSTNHKHAAVILTALFFSAFHMQFFRFIPRFALGLILGYALIWSGSIWLPVIGHFVNNGTAVILAFAANKKGIPFNQDTIGTEPGELWILILSLLITGAGLGFLHKRRIQEDVPGAHLSE